MDHTSLLFAEDFSGDVLNATRWERCPAESRQGGYLKLTVEAAAWAGSGTEDAIRALPADMVADYVRVYAKNPYEV